MSVVIGAVAFDNKMEKQQPTLLSALGPHVAGLLSGGNAQANVFIVDTLPEPQRRVARQVLYNTIRDIWIVFVVLAAAGLITCFGVKRNQLSKRHQEVRTGLAAEEEKRKRAVEMRRGQI